MALPADLVTAKAAVMHRSCWSQNWDKPRDTTGGLSKGITRRPITDSTLSKRSLHGEVNPGHVPGAATERRPIASAIDMEKFE